MNELEKLVRQKEARASDSAAEWRDIAGRWQEIAEMRRERADWWEGMSDKWMTLCNQYSRMTWWFLLWAMIASIAAIVLLDRVLSS